MKIDNLEFNAELDEILNELQRQLHMNEIPLLNKMKDTSSDIMVTCPYHSEGQEKRPSAGIRKSDGLFHCFACNETHPLPEVISHCFGKDSTGAFGWRWLLQNFGTVSVEERKDVELDYDRYNRINNKSNSDDSYIKEDELDKYRYLHPYMYKRKLTDDIIEKFDIGYDKETDCITFPIRDSKGNVLALARRSIKGKYFNYPDGFEKPVYGLYELKKYGERVVSSEGRLMRVPDYQEIIVCESMLDALTCWVYGKYAVALNGLGTELQFKQLRDLPCRTLILATDNDKAGWAARARIRYNVKNKLIKQYILPSNRKDINELSEQEFKELKEVF